MKKQLKWIVAALAATAMATPAFALTVDTKGFLEIRGQADRNLIDGTNGTADDDRTGVDQRLRLWTEAAADENVKAVFAIEADTFWGDTTFGDVGSDSKDIEIKHVYLDFNLPAVKGTNVKAGTQYFKIGNGFIAGDDASGLQTATKLSDAATLKLYWVKAVEGAFGTGSDDVDFYGAQADLKAGSFNVSPILAWTRAAKNTDIYFAGVDGNGKLGADSKLAFTLIKNWGDNLGGRNVDGLAFYLGFFTKAAGLDLSAEYAWVGDDGRADGQFIDGSGATTGNGWAANSPTELMGGARYDRRGGIGQGLGATSGTGVGDLYYLNQQYLKLALAKQTSEKTKLTAYVAQIMAATDESGTSNNNDISEAYGTELGCYYDITLAKGLTYGLMGAYLVNDDFGLGDDDVYKLGNALTYKF